MNISTIILNNTSWGCNKTEKEIPVVGATIKIYMKGKGMTNANSDVVLDIAYKAVCSKLNFTYSNEFEELMKYQTTMIGKETAQGILRQYWDAVKDELKSTPQVFNLVKETVIHINSTLVDSNSRPKMIKSFKSYIIDNGAELI